MQVPNPNAAMGPTPYDPHKDHELPSHDDHKEDKEDHPFLALPDHDHHEKTAPSPSGDSENVFDDISSQQSAINPNPLYNVVIGRKMMH